MSSLCLYFHYPLGYTKYTFMLLIKKLSLSKTSDTSRENKTEKRQKGDYTFLPQGKEDFIGILTPIKSSLPSICTLI